MTKGDAREGGPLHGQMSERTLTGCDDKTSNAARCQDFMTSGARQTGLVAPDDVEVIAEHFGALLDAQIILFVVGADFRDRLRREGRQVGNG